MWAARFAAPVAFFFAAIVLVMLVQNGLSSETTTDTRRTAPAASAGRDVTVTDGGGGGGETRSSSERPGRRFYRVQAGDTLESIASQFGTTVEELLQLNPNVDPLALSPGQRLRVR